MKSITIHGMEPELAARLVRQARESGLSLNKAIKRLLAQALGIAPTSKKERRRDLDAMCGMWSEREAKAFKKATRDFEGVDAEDWR